MNKVIIILKNFKKYFNYIKSLKKILINLVLLIIIFYY